MARWIKLLGLAGPRMALVMALVLLAGCGGGDAEDEPDQDVRPPACQADPKACV
jgi:hypothetical protein